MEVNNSIDIRGESEPGKASEPLPPASRRKVVLFVGLMMLFSVPLIVNIYRGARRGHTQTNAVIIVYGAPQWDGAIVVVAGVELPYGELLDRFSARENLIVRFHVPPGKYTVTVQKDGKTLAQKNTSGANGPKDHLLPGEVWRVFQPAK